MTEDAVRPPRPDRVWRDLTILGIVAALFIAAMGAGGMALYRQFYGPSAFVMNYIDLLADGRAADALRIPGVTVDRTQLAEAGVAADASDALLRQAALAPLTNVQVVSEQTTDAVTTVTVSYLAAGHAGQSTFSVQQEGWVGITPNWRFATSPLASIQLDLRGADDFVVNGFAMQRQQVSPAGAQADPLAPVPLLVFTPGTYAFSVDTPIATASGVAVLADQPLAATNLGVQAQPTPEFTAVVQQRVEEFLTTCTTQQVLQPTGCPFGLEVDNRIASEPVWSMTTQPTVVVAPDGAQWRIPPTDALAHIEVDIQSLFDGTIRHVSEDVPFQIDGTIEILSDGSASIKVGSPNQLD